MKYFLITFLFIPSAVCAQYNFLNLSNSQVYFERIYTLDSASLNEVSLTVIAGMPKIKDLTKIEKSEGLLTATINGTYIDYKKYGGKWGQLPPFINYPFFGDVMITWKEGKYRVQVSNMYFNTTGFGIMKCSEVLTKNRGAIFHTHPNIIAAGKYIEQYLAELFLMKKETNDW